MTTMPQWLTAHLQATGRLNTDGISRRIRATQCRDCGATVLRGLDADAAALAVTVDPHPLNPLGEALALLQPRRTYSLQPRHPAGHQIDPRDRVTIETRPAGTDRNTDTLAEHQCHATPLPTTTSAFDRRPDLPDEPPF